MHVYIYDSFLNHKKYDRVLAQVETSITDFGLNGKISRLNIMQNIKEIINNEIKRGAKTITAVGNDKTVSQVANAMALSNIPLGIIPIGQADNKIAACLGIDSAESACEILSARRIAKLDIGLAGSTYFLRQACIDSRDTIMEISKNYSLEIMGSGEIRIINLAWPEKEPIKDNKFNPQDGVLELCVTTKKAAGLFARQLDRSIFPVKKLTIKNKTYPLILDGALSVATPADITVLKQKLSVIVGRNRYF